MGLKDNLGKFADKAKVVVDKSGDKIAAGVDKVTDTIDTKTGGKYHDKLEKVDDLAAKLDKKTKAATDAVDEDPTPTTTPDPTPGV